MNDEEVVDYDMDAIRGMIRDVGLRCTPTRIAVLAFGLKQKAPFTHNHLVQACRGKGFESSTLFRALADFAERGLMKKLDVGDHLFRYEVERSHDHHPQHPHFLCTDCGGVSCLLESTSSFAAHATSLIGNHSIVDVLFKGVCGECLQK